VRRAIDIIADFRVLPIASIDTITNSGSVMVLAPHPDDESLGCGGLIAELAENGRPPVIVVMSDGRDLISGRVVIQHRGYALCVKRKRQAQ
jgi:hypothetical protein